jgi:hypothetical protein
MKTNEYPMKRMSYAEVKALIERNPATFRFGRKISQKKLCKWFEIMVPEFKAGAKHTDTVVSRSAIYQSQKLRAYLTLNRVLRAEYGMAIKQANFVHYHITEFAKVPCELHRLDKKIAILKSCRDTFSIGYRNAGGFGFNGVEE